MDRDRLEAELSTAFGGDPAVRRTVARQARDLADSGRVRADFGYELTATDVVGHLADAPEGASLAERWNWWLGSLDVAGPGYRQFRVRTDADEN